MANQEENIALTILKPLFKYKWLWLLPFLLAMSGVSAYTKDKYYYKSSGTLSFHTEFFLGGAGGKALSPFEHGIQELIASLKYGSKLDEITDLAYPDLKNQNPEAFKSKSRQLASGEGVKLSFRRDYVRALVVSYTADNPKEAYNVVDSTIKTIQKYARSGADDRIQNSMSFLLSNMEKLKQEMFEIDQESIKIKNNLSPILGSNVSLSDQFSDDSLTPFIDKSLSQSASHQESLPKLQFELHVAEKELERLQEKLKKPIGELVLNERESVKSKFLTDPLIKDLEKSLVLNEKKHSLLRTQGFRNAHPKQANVLSEIGNLKNLIAGRKQELRSSQNNVIDSSVSYKIRQEIQSKLSFKNEEISKINDKIKILESYQKNTKEDKNKFSETLGTIAKEKSRLEELIQQKYVKTQAYSNAAQELEEKRRYKQASEDDVGLKVTIEEFPFIPNNPLPYAHLGIYFIATILSLGLGFGLIFILVSLNTSINCISKLELLTEIPSLGSIDKFSEENDKNWAYLLGLESFLLLIAMLITYSLVLKFGA